MKRVGCILLSNILLICIVACSPDAVGTLTWQEQYDLGIRYLSEGNYEEAIIAFTAAIEIDPKQASAYVGRGNAYVLSGETEENLTAAQADYEQAIELDETLVEAYLGLADIYICKGDYDKALEILQQGLHNVDNTQILTDKIAEIENWRSVAQTLYNSGGGVDFTQRENYFEYDMLLSTEQNSMIAYVEALLTQDKESLLKLSEEAAYSNQEMIFLTIWQNYKVSIDSRSQVNDDQYILRNVAEIEIRPQNGVGYYAWIEWADHQPEHDSAGFFEEVHSINKSITIITCPCKNWAWNGGFNCFSQYNLTQEYLREGKSSVSHFLQERSSSGSVIDGMCDGVTVETIIDTDLDDSYTYQSTARYYCDNGTLLKWENDISGEVVTHTPQTNNGVCIIYGYGSQWGYGDKQRLLDRLYW